MAGGTQSERRVDEALTHPPIVADASTLIALERIDRLDVLIGLFGTVIVPLAVAREVGPALSTLPWIDVTPLALPIVPRVALASLGHGESEAISLALELIADQIILDDEPARALAQQLGLPVIGTLGLLRTAKDRGLLPEVRTLVDALVATGFRLSPILYRSFLTLVREGA